MNTETVDKLFLELSQFTRALTAREIKLAESLAIYVHAHETGNSVPPHIDNQARDLLESLKGEELSHLIAELANQRQRLLDHMDNLCIPLDEYEGDLDSRARAAIERLRGGGE